MEQRDALRMMRSEIGLTQADLAYALNVTYVTVNRWENSDTRPNVSASVAIMGLARKHNVSTACMDILSRVLFSSRADDEDDRSKLKQATEEMKSEQRELITAEQFKMLIDHLDVAIIAERIYRTKKNKSVLIYHNAQLAKIFQYEEGAFHARISKNVTFPLDADSTKAYYEQRKRLLDGEIQLSDFVVHIKGKRKDGTFVWLEVKALSLQEYSFGHELYVSCRDITEQREEKTIRNSLLEALPGGVIIYKFGKHSEIQYYSEKVTELNGYTKEEFTEIERTNPGSNVFPDDRAETEKISVSAIADGKPFTCVYRVRHKNGSLIWVQATASMIREEPDGKVYCIVCTRPPAGTALYRDIVEQAETAVVAKHGIEIPNQ